MYIHLMSVYLSDYGILQFQSNLSQKIGISQAFIKILK
jgi:hypothetical protein